MRENEFLMCELMNELWDLDAAKVIDLATLEITRRRRDLTIFLLWAHQGAKKRINTDFDSVTSS